jgi:hypothetical protein
MMARREEWSPQERSLGGGPGFGRIDQILSELLPGGPRRESCPACGWTDLECLRTGLAGCPLCYDALPSLAPDPCGEESS